MIRSLEQFPDQDLRNVIQEQFEMYQQNLTNEIEERKKLLNPTNDTDSVEDDTTQIESSISELTKDRLKDQQRLFELESALKYLEVQCKYSSELYQRDPENKACEDEEKSIKKVATEILSRLNEKLILIASTMPDK